MLKYPITDAMRTRLQRARGEISQIELANQTGIGQATLSKIERGRQNFITEKQLLLIARDTGCSIPWLLGEAYSAEAGKSPRTRILYSEDAIARRIVKLSGEIAAAGYRDLLMVTILHGGFIFGADLARALAVAGLPVEIDFITLRSYGEETASPGKVELVRDMSQEVARRDVMFVDDIADSGHTLVFARDLALGRGANRIGIAVFLDKRFRRTVALKVDHVGFDCPNKWVFGYGMDLKRTLRELPYVAVLEDDSP